MASVAKHKVKLTLPVFLLLPWAQFCCADVISLSPVQDVRLLSFYPNTVHNDVLSVYNDNSSNIQQSLIEFDLSGVPVGSIINSATLSLLSYSHSPRQRPGEHTDIHAVNKGWAEDQATWINAKSSDPWSTVGGDFSSMVYASNDDVVSVEGTVMDWDITSLVSDWVDGSLTNYGLAMTGNVGNAMYFYSSATAGKGPSVEIDYSPVPVPSAVLLGALGLGTAAARLRRRRDLKS